MAKKPFDEGKMKAGQREAALRLTENEFADKKERKTKQEIADELGIARMTLYRWEHEDENFIAFKNYLADTFLRSFFPTVVRKHMEGINLGSAKLIELFYKKFGMLAADQQIITIDDGSDSPEERAKRLAERLAAMDKGE